MDFQNLSRKDLQTLCKKNKIPANLTNVAMANALQVLEIVEGIEDFQQLGDSATPQLLPGSPEKTEARSPDLPRTSRRTSNRTRPVKDPVVLKENELKDLQESALTLTRTRRGTAAKASTTRRRICKDEEQGNEEFSDLKQILVENKGSEIPKTPATRNGCKRATGTSVRRNIETRLGEEKDEKENENPIATGLRTYSTRRSSRLSEKKLQEGALSIQKNRGRKEVIKIIPLSEECEEYDDKKYEKDTSADLVLPKSDELIDEKCDSEPKDDDLPKICDYIGEKCEPNPIADDHDLSKNSDCDRNNIESDPMADVDLPNIEDCIIKKYYSDLSEASVEDCNLDLKNASIAISIERKEDQAKKDATAAAYPDENAREEQILISSATKNQVLPEYEEERSPKPDADADLDLDLDSAENLKMGFLPEYEEERSPKPDADADLDLDLDSAENLKMGCSEVLVESPKESEKSSPDAIASEMPEIENCVDDAYQVTDLKNDSAIDLPEEDEDSGNDSADYPSPIENSKSEHCEMPDTALNSASDVRKEDEESGNDIVDSPYPMGNSNSECGNCDSTLECADLSSSLEIMTLDCQDLFAENAASTEFSSEISILDDCFARSETGSIEISPPKNTKDLDCSVNNVSAVFSGEIPASNQLLIRTPGSLRRNKVGASDSGNLLGSNSCGVLEMGSEKRKLRLSNKKGTTTTPNRNQIFEDVDKENKGGESLRKVGEDVKVNKKGEVKEKKNKVSKDMTMGQLKRLIKETITEIDKRSALQVLNENCLLVERDN